MDFIAHARASTQHVIHAGVECSKVVFVKNVFNHRVRRAIPIARIAVQLDRANGARANVGAVPAPGFCPKFLAYVDVSVFQYGDLRMVSIGRLSWFTRHDAA